MMQFYMFLIFTTAVSGFTYQYKTKYNHDWEFYKSSFNKTYHMTDESYRRFIWEMNAERVAEHNRQFDLGIKTYTLGLNEYADLTGDEFRLMFNGYKISRNLLGKNPHFIFNNTDVSKLNQTVDWRNKGVVTPVKNQQQCGSCWAFSAIGAIESHLAMKTGNLTRLSEQNLLDCADEFYGNFGCDGGMPDNAFHYVIKNKGVNAEADYPYQQEMHRCRFKKDKVAGTISKYVDVLSGNEKALQKAVAEVGPVSVAIDASHWSFQFYSGGIYNELFCSPLYIDHAVLVVGYGTHNRHDYWLVKNSWGRSWGDKGYIKMSRNKRNQCGIATIASYPVV